MKQPEKPKLKKWLAATVAVAGLSGVFGGGMMVNTVTPPSSNETMTVLTVGNEISAQFNMTGDKITSYRALTPPTAGNDFLRMNDDQLLRSASLLREPEIAQYLISKGANVHAVNDEALRLAARGGDFDTIRVLVNAGANIHVNNEEALRTTVKQGRFEIAQFLVSKGAIADQQIINDAELIETTADLSMPMTKALQLTLPTPLPGGHS